MLLRINKLCMSCAALGSALARAIFSALREDIVVLSATENHNWFSAYRKKKVEHSKDDNLFSPTHVCEESHATRVVDVYMRIVEIVNVASLLCSYTWKSHHTSRILPGGVADMVDVLSRVCAHKIQPRRDLRAFQALLCSQLNG